MQTSIRDNEREICRAAVTQRVAIDELVKSTREYLSEVYTHTGLVRLASSTGRIRLAAPKSLDEKRTTNCNNGIGNLDSRPNWRKLMKSARLNKEVIA